MVWLTKNLLPILAGALLASLLTNVGIGIALKHSISAVAECRAVVKQTTEAAKEKKQIIERKDNGIVSDTDTRTRSRIDSVLSARRRIVSTSDRLHDSQGRVGNLSVTPGSTIVSDSSGSTPVVLPIDPDEAICLTNTVLAEEWQTFYADLRKNRKEENSKTNP